MCEATGSETKIQLLDVDAAALALQELVAGRSAGAEARVSIMVPCVPRIMLTLPRRVAIPEIATDHPNRQVWHGFVVIMRIRRPHGSTSLGQSKAKGDVRGEVNVSYDGVLWEMVERDEEHRRAVVGPWTFEAKRIGPQGWRYMVRHAQKGRIGSRVIGGQSPLNAIKLAAATFLRATGEIVPVV